MKKKNSGNIGELLIESLAGQIVHWEKKVPQVKNQCSHTAARGNAFQFRLPVEILMLMVFCLIRFRLKNDVF